MNDNRKIGLFFIGGLGSTATLTTFVISLLQNNLVLENGNFISSLSDFKNIKFLSPEKIEHVGGVDIRKCSLYQNIKEIAKRDNLNINGLLENKKIKQTLRKWDRNFCIGITNKDTSNSKAIYKVKKILTEFRKKQKLDLVYVIYLSSAERHLNYLDRITLGELKKIIKENERPLSPNILYTYAVLDSGFPFINFTSCQANSIPALKELANLRKVAHCGKDGKTGETYLKTVLAPALKLRHFPILFWESHNILGDNDGFILQDGKLRKDKILDKTLSVKLSGNVKEHNVRIDFVKALGDWKTAWNLIEWEGLLGSRMSLQFIWKGHDGLLAAPMIWDIVKFIDIAVRRGNYGVQDYLSFFFKNPLDCNIQNPIEQFEILKNYILSSAKYERIEKQIKT